MMTFEPCCRIYKRPVSCAGRSSRRSLKGGAMIFETTCQRCGRTYLVSRREVIQLGGLWRRCPDCRSAPGSSSASLSPSEQQAFRGIAAGHNREVVA
jgi:hypothetical protein